MISIGGQIVRFVCAWLFPLQMLTAVIFFLKRRERGATSLQAGRRADRQAGKQAGRPGRAGKQTDRQANRQANRKTGRHARR